MATHSFAEIREQFTACIGEINYATMVTVDRLGRPRTRVLIEVWEIVEDRPLGWLATYRTPVKAAHLAAGPAHDALSVFYGGLFPAVCNLQLALRSRGPGSTLTGYHLEREAEAAAILGIPAGVPQVGLLPVGYTTAADFRAGPRTPVEEISYPDGWGRAAGRAVGHAIACSGMDGVRGLLVDIDGVLTVSWKPLGGAVAALRAVRNAGLPFVLLTNTTSRTRDRIAGTLADAGFPVGPQDVLTAPAAAAAHLREHRPGARCLLLNSGDDITADLAGVRLVSGPDADPDVVLVGGAGPEFGYRELNDAFGHLQRGAELFAMHRNLYWRTEDGLQLDTGAFLLGLERAAGVEAVVLGKPAGAFFAAALRTLGVSAEQVLMVGDDLEADVLGAQGHGVAGVLVRTGKFRAGDEDGVDGHRPRHVLDSVADLPGLLGIG
jgi:HAD superfamily hydrolase (TIGR01458 family)